MRLNWMIQSGMVVTSNDIQAGAHEFFLRYGATADTIRLSHKDYSFYLTSNYTPTQVLEKGKQYGLFIAIPGGMAELVLLDQNDESIANNTGNSMIIIESTQIDREFERHVLNKDQNV